MRGSIVALGLTIVIAALFVDNRENYTEYQRELIKAQLEVEQYKAIAAETEELRSIAEKSQELARDTLDLLEEREQISDAMYCVIDKETDIDFMYYNWSQVDCSLYNY